MKEYKTSIPKISLVRESSTIKKVKVSRSSDIADYVRTMYDTDLTIFESFYIVLFNRANNTNGYAKISQGGISGTVTDVRIIAKYAIESLSSSVIIVHNHPSGNTEPSDSDHTITAKIRDALKLFDIQLLDHIILTEDSYHSFADNGDL